MTICFERIKTMSDESTNKNEAEFSEPCSKCESTKIEFVPLYKAECAGCDNETEYFPSREKAATNWNIKESETRRFKEEQGKSEFFTCEWENGGSIESAVFPNLESIVSISKSATDIEFYVMRPGGINNEYCIKGGEFIWIPPHQRFCLADRD